MSGLEHFPDDAHAITDGAAVGIGSMIPLWKEKFVGQVAHAGIHIHDVESGGARPSGGIRLPANDVTNVRGIHDARAQVAHETDMGRHPRNARG